MELRHLEDGINPADTDTADPQNGDNHGSNGGTQSTQCTGRNVHHAAEEIRDTQIGQTHHAPMQSLCGIGDIEGEQCRPVQIYNRGNADAQYAYAGKAYHQNTGDTLVLLCPVILADIIECGLMKAVQNDIQKAVDVRSGGIATHYDVPEGVDGGLNDDIGDREQGALDTGGQTYSNDTQQLRLIKTHFGKRQLAGILPFHQCNDNQNSGNPL